MEKTKVMLVDDEILAVDYIQNLIDWEGLGYQIVSTAYNGRQALMHFQKFRPALVITDISMPLMGGIDLIQVIKQTDPNVKTILLTAYGEFAYARAALQEGVDAYLMKDEMTAELLTATLAEINKAMADYRRISDILFQKAILDWFSEGEAYVKSHYLDPDVNRFFAERFQYIIVQQDLPLRPDGEIDKTREIKPSQILKNCIGAATEKKALQYAVVPGRRLLIFFHLKDSEYKVYQQLRDQAAAYRQALSAGLDGRFTVFIEHRQKTLSQISYYFDSQRMLAELSFQKGAGGIYDLMETESISKEVVDIDRDTVEQILKAAAPDLFWQYIRQLTARSGTGYVPSATYLELTGILASLSKRSLRTCVYDWQEGVSLLHQLTAEIVGSSLDSGREYSREVLRMLQYMDDNYAGKDFSISRLAEAVGMSCSRCSVVFKQETRQTINQYVTAMRIDKARELLEQGELKIYEIAERVGYANSQYLSRIFFKETGYYPADYKKRGGS